MESQQDSARSFPLTLRGIKNGWLYFVLLFQLIEKKNAFSQSPGPNVYDVPVKLIHIMKGRPWFPSFLWCRYLKRVFVAMALFGLG